MPGDGPVGRNAELGRVDAFLDAAREDVRSLAITGPAGIGKTAVWQEGARRAADSGFVVLTARPTGGEVKLSFAALSDLLAPVDGGMLLALPAQQRHALESALLRADVGDTPLDSRAVATGALSLLRELALSAPLLLAVDDAQWLDAASAAALGFAVRRLDGLPVGVLATVRIEEDRPESFEQFLPRERRDELEIAGLGLAALHAVLKQQLGRVFPRPVLVRIAAASAGNPFYALEIGRELDRMGVPTSRGSAAGSERGEVARAGAVATAAGSDVRGTPGGRDACRGRTSRCSTPRPWGRPRSRGSSPSPMTEASASAIPSSRRPSTSRPRRVEGGGCTGRSPSALPIQRSTRGISRWPQPDPTSRPRAHSTVPPNSSRAGVRWRSPSS